MKIKTRDVADGFNALANLCSKEIPFKTAYQLARLTRVIQNEYQLFEEYKMKLCTMYGEVSEDDPNTCHIKPENIQEFNIKMNELLDQDIDIDIEKVDLTGLDINISAVDLISIISFIKIDD